MKHLADIEVIPTNESYNTSPRVVFKVLRWTDYCIHGRALRFGCINCDYHKLVVKQRNREKRLASFN